MTLNGVVKKALILRYFAEFAGRLRHSGWR